jgi:hypothetical protein
LGRGGGADLWLHDYWSKRIYIFDVIIRKGVYYKLCVFGIKIILYSN